jgi:hypothetical protein
VKQRHNAHCQPGEVTIRYRFHPRCGEAVIATGRIRHGDEVALIIRQPDGTLAQLPVWMMEERATGMRVTELPCLSLTCLRELRLELVAGQAWSATTPAAKETSMPRPQPSRRHPNLFASHEPPVPIAASERTKLLALMSSLLVETLAAVRVEANDEDHA